MRFPEFKAEWKRKKLGEVMDFKVTNSYSREKLNYEKGTVKNIHYGDIHTKFRTLFNITNEIVPYINEEINIEKIAKDNYCQEGDVIFADASEDLNDVGKSIEIVKLNSEKLLSGLHTLLARPKRNIFFVGFNGYLFKSNFVRSQIQKEAQGIKVSSISAKRISNTELFYPTHQEQTKIASFLSLIDERIQTQMKIIEEWEKLKKGLQEQIFLQKLRFKDENEKVFVSWKEKKLGEIATITTGKLDANAMVKNGKFRFYTCAKEFFYINKYAFDTEALLISGNGANVGYIHHYKGKFNAYQRTYVLYSIEENILYLKYYLEQFLFQRILLEKRDGNTPYIVLSTLSEMNILFPCLKEQSNIANFLSSIDNKINLEKSLLSAYQEQKKYLLQNLFI